MRFGHLSFAQLARLHSVETLMRVTRVYHVALEQAASRYPGRIFLVAEAEKEFAEIAARYRPVISFLQGTDIKKALKNAARRDAIPKTPENLREFRVIPVRRYAGQGDRALDYARCMAKVIQAFCLHNGVLAKIFLRGSGILDEWVVMAATNDTGIEQFNWVRGWGLASIERICDQQHCVPRMLFPWLPVEFDGSRRINPALIPVNTPNIRDIAAELIESAN